MSELKFWLKIIAGSAVMGVLISFVVMKTAISSGSVEVPEIVNQPRANAEFKLQKVGLEMNVIEERFSTSAPFGSVLGQDIEAGVTVKQGREIGVIISKGTRLVAVPDLVGMRSSRQARLLLEQNGLVPGNMEQVHHRALRDSVIAQSPEPGLQVDRGSRVSLLISLEPEKSEWVMPGLIGRELHLARETLTAMGLVMRDIEMLKSEGTPGTVLYQSVSAGARVQHGQPINLSVVDNETMKARYALIEYPVPDEGVAERRVQIIVIDARGRRVVHTAMEKPGAQLRIPSKAWGRATYQVSLAGEIVFEKEIPE